MANPPKETEKSLNDLVLNPGSERNLLSICLKNPDKMIDVQDAEIFIDHFGVEGNKYIYMALMYLYEKKAHPTPLAIMEVLSSDTARATIEELGGLEYLSILGESTIPEDNLPLFIGKVKQSYTRRMLHNIYKEEMKFILSDGAEVLNPNELVSRVEQRLADLSASTVKVTEVYKMGDETEAVLAQRAENPSEVPGLETGMAQFDKLTNGGQPGDLIVVCAESKTGKSVLLTNWANKLNIDDQIPGLYVDTEMNHREQEDRLLSMRTGIPHSEIVSGLYVIDTEHGTADEKVAKLKKARAELGLGNYYHIYMPHFTAEKVGALAKKFQLQFGIKVLFFDYIKISSSDTGSLGRLREDQALGFFTSSLKDLAGILNIPIYTACQTNREDLGNTQKDAKAIGGSYRILQLASKLVFLTNKSDEQIARDGFQNGNQVLQIAYQRNGESNCPPINIFFNKPIIKQVEV